jgi:FkbM family methyltransferase
MISHLPGIITLRNLYLEYRKPTVNISVDGTNCDFIITNHQERKNILFMEEEKSVIKLFLNEIKNGDVFYDVGSNVGLYSCFACKKAQLEEIVAFEPQPEVNARLKENIEQNGCADKTKIIKGVLAAEGGKQNLVVDESVPATGATTHSMSPNADGERIEVRAYTVDELITQNACSSPDVMKIDVEGAEYEVLQGMSQVLSKSPPRAIFVEIHDQVKHFGATPDEVKSLLREAGYLLEVLDEQENREFVHAKVASNGG